MNINELIKYASILKRSFEESTDQSSFEEDKQIQIMAINRTDPELEPHFKNQQLDEYNIDFMQSNNEYNYNN